MRNSSDLARLWTKRCIFPSLFAIPAYLSLCLLPRAAHADAAQPQASGERAASGVVTESVSNKCVRDVFEVYSPSMGRKIPVIVLRPAEGAVTRNFPVLYALHGRNAPAKAFSDMPPLCKFVAEHPMLVVSFQADKDSGYIDATSRESSKFTTFFFDELIPEIERRYPVSSKKAITGFSMGGYGALHYVMAQPGIFSSASSLSGAFELFDISAGLERSAKNQEWTASLLGSPDTNAALYRAVSLSDRLDELAKRGGGLPPLLILCGTEDHLLDANRRFVGHLKAVAEKTKPENDSAASAVTIPFEYREDPGGHDFKFWSGHAREVAEFHWKHF